MDNDNSLQKSLIVKQSDWKVSLRLNLQRLLKQTILKTHREPVFKCYTGNNMALIVEGRQPLQQHGWEGVSANSIGRPIDREIGWELRGVRGLIRRVLTC